MSSNALHEAAAHPDYESANESVARQAADRRYWESPEFRETPDIDDPESRRSDEVGGLLEDGHGFTVQTSGTARPEPPPCPHCAGPMYPQPTWVCECTMEDVRPESDIGCGCNWCVINRNGLPGRGRPRHHCGKSECKRAFERERKRAQRAGRAVPSTP